MIRHRVRQGDVPIWHWRSDIGYLYFATHIVHNTPYTVHSTPYTAHSTQHLDIPIEEQINKHQGLTPGGVEITNNEIADPMH